MNSLNLLSRIVTRTPRALATLKRKKRKARCFPREARVVGRLLLNLGVTSYLLTSGAHLRVPARSGRSTRAMMMRTMRTLSPTSSATTTTFMVTTLMIFQMHHLKSHRLELVYLIQSFTIRRHSGPTSSMGLATLHSYDACTTSTSIGSGWQLLRARGRNQISL